MMATRKRATLTLQKELEQAAEGVSLMSESDRPLRFFTLPAEGEQSLTPEGFLHSLGFTIFVLEELELSVESLIEERSFEGFFPTADDIASSNGVELDDPDVVAESGGYRRVEGAVRKRLRDVKVFRVGRVEIRCYIAGLDERGHLAGLVTTAIET